MPDIGDIMDVNIEDLSPEQQQQLQDAADQFQQKCLLSFKKNRSGVCRCFRPATYYGEYPK
jgi:hypothetical protein